METVDAPITGTWAGRANSATPMLFTLEDADGVITGTAQLGTLGIACTVTGTSAGGRIGMVATCDGSGFRYDFHVLRLTDDVMNGTFYPEGLGDVGLTLRRQ